MNGCIRGRRWILLVGSFTCEIYIICIASDLLLNAIIGVIIEKELIRPSSHSIDVSIVSWAEFMVCGQTDSQIKKQKNDKMPSYYRLSIIDSNLIVTCKNNEFE